MGGLASVGEVSSYMKESRGTGGGDVAVNKGKKMKGIFVNKDGIKELKNETLCKTAAIWLWPAGITRHDVKRFGGILCSIVKAI